jgi:hypothetical protein
MHSLCNACVEFFDDLDFCGMNITSCGSQHILSPVNIAVFATCLGIFKVSLRLWDRYLFWSGANNLGTQPELHLDKNM